MERKRKLEITEYIKVKKTFFTFLFLSGFDVFLFLNVFVIKYPSTNVTLNSILMIFFIVCDVT